MFTIVQEKESQESLLPPISGAAGLSRALRWFDAQAKCGRRSPFAAVHELTPELARVLLERNPSNRLVKDSTVRRYARDIEAGRFTFNGEPIIISSDGELNDGQHRCHAVIYAQKPIRTLFMFGAPRESRVTLDQGSARTAGDYLGMNGVQNCNNISAIACKIMEVERCGKFVTQQIEKPSKSEVVERAMADDAIAASFKVVHRKGANRVANTTILGCAHYLFAQVDRDDADGFIERLISGAELKSRDPIFVAREKLLKDDKRLKPNEKMKTIIMAWNNYRASRSVRNLTHSVRKGEKLPEIR